MSTNETDYEEEEEVDYAPYNLPADDAADGTAEGAEPAAGSCGECDHEFVALCLYPDPGGVVCCVCYWRHLRDADFGLCGGCGAVACSVADYAHSVQVCSQAGVIQMTARCCSGILQHIAAYRAKMRGNS